MSNNQVNVNQNIINALSVVSSRLKAIEKCIDKTEEQLQGKLFDGLTGNTSPVVSSVHSQDLDYSDTVDATIIPTAKFLKAHAVFKKQ